MNSYIAINPSTMEIVDRFTGTQEDVSLRDQDLIFMTVPENIRSECVRVSKNETTGNFEITEDAQLVKEYEDNVRSTNVSMLRMTRNTLLKDSDWTVGNDSPLSQEKIEEWKIYRQSLRDFPDNVTDIVNPIWPVPPQ